MIFLIKYKRKNKIKIQRKLITNKTIKNKPLMTI